MVAKKLDFYNTIHEMFPYSTDRDGRVKLISQYTGEIGIEVECEGSHLPREIRSYWRVVPDGSLRGESAEYVLIKPVQRNKVLNFLKYLNKQFLKNETVVHDSPRTSVHVHVNMSDKTLVQVFNYVICYLILENLLVAFAGSRRVGNLFCLRACDAEFLIDFLVQSAKKKQFNPNQDQIRYTSINICALTKYNSLEFRAMRGTVDPKLIETWSRMLVSIKDGAMGYGTPPDIINDFSILGPCGFIQKMLPFDFAVFTAMPNYEQYMFDSMRLVQEIVYAAPWGRQEKEGVGRFFHQHANREPLNAQEDFEWPNPLDVEIDEPVDQF